MEWINGDYTLSDETSTVQIDAVHTLLSSSYWSSDRPVEVIKKSLEGSLNFSLFHHGRQVGFTRAITDRVTFAYLCDVIIEERLRGQGIGQWMLARILEHPDLQVNRISLTTQDAHGFYGKFGFMPVQAMVRDKAKEERVLATV